MSVNWGPLHGVIKRVFGFVKVRYRGLDKNAHRLFVTCGLANLYLAQGRYWLRERRAASAALRRSGRPAEPARERRIPASGRIQILRLRHHHYRAEQMAGLIRVSLLGEPDGVGRVFIRPLFDHDDVMFKANSPNSFAQLHLLPVDSIKGLELCVIYVFGQIEKPTVTGVNEFRISDVPPVPL